MLRVLLLVFAAACGRLDFETLVASDGPRAWLPGYRYRTAITFDPNADVSEVAGMPLLVVLDSSDITYSHAATDGGDVRFTGADGVSVLPHEIEHWDPAGRSVVWVRSAGDTTMFMYTGSSTPPVTIDPSAVWVDFQLVWHMNRSVGGALIDSTGHGNEGSVFGATFVAGPAGDAMQLDGTAAYAAAPDDPNLRFSNGTAFTLTAVAQPTQFGPTARDLIRYDDCDNADGDTNCGTRPQYSLRLETTGAVNLFFGVTTQGGNLVSTTPLSGGSRHIIEATRQRSLGRLALALDGAIESNVDSSTGTWSTSGEYVLVGRYDVGGGAEYFKGVIDEVRIATIERSDAWLALDALNLGNVLLLFAAEETAP